MLFKLIKKDILIIRGLFRWGCLILLLVPVLLSSAHSVIDSSYSFLFMSELGFLLFGQALSIEESKSPDATAVLLSTPYHRRTIVAAKYIEFILLFVVCFIINHIIFVLIAPSYLGNFADITYVWLLLILLISIYLPIECKHGVNRSKYIFAAVTIIISIGPLYISYITDEFTILPDVLISNAISGKVLGIIFIVLSIIILSVSIIVSNVIFARTDL